MILTQDIQNLAELEQEIDRRIIEVHGLASTFEVDQGDLTEMQSRYLALQIQQAKELILALAATSRWAWALKQSLGEYPKGG